MSENPDWAFAYGKDPSNLTTSRSRPKVVKPEAAKKRRRQSVTVRMTTIHTASRNGKKEANMATKPQVKKPTTAAKPASKGKTTPVVILFDYEKDTPGTFRFSEQGEKDEQLLVTAYLKKARTTELFGKQPKGLEVTIKPIF